MSIEYKTNDDGGTAELHEIAELTPTFNSCKGLLFKQYLVLLSNEQTLFALDLNLPWPTIEEPVGRYELQGQSNVKLVGLPSSLKRRGQALFIIISLKYQLFRMTEIPAALQTPGGPRMRFECLREMLAFEFQVTSNKILYLSSTGTRKHRFLLEHTVG